MMGFFLHLLLRNFSCIHNDVTYTNMRTAYPLKTIEMRKDGRFISYHSSGIDVYYDSGHKIIKFRVYEGCLATLVMDQNTEGHWRARMLEVWNRDGSHSVTEYSRNQLMTEEEYIAGSSATTISTPRRADTTIKHREPSM